MTTTLRAPTVTPHYAQPSRLAQLAAPKLGMRPNSVEQLIHGHDPIQVRFAALIAAAVELRDHEMVSRLMTPVEAALTGLKLEASSFEVLLTEAEAIDCAEELATKDYLRTRGQEELKTWRRRIRSEIGVKQRFLAAMDATLAEADAASGRHGG